MNIHYLDNSATTQVCKEAADAAYRMMRENYGNPSSLHKAGIRAEKAVEEARGIIADSLNVQPKTIYFTSGGTEANNTALFGAAQALKRRGDRVIVSAIEHSSVYESAKRLAELSFDVQFAPVTEQGVVDIDALKALLTDKTILVSIMTVNNETGSIQPIERIAKLVHKNCPEALFHTDAVQAYGKMALKPKKWGVDLMSISAHKIYGPKGTGALYIRQGTKLAPQITGGNQEKKMRAGTENVPAIAGFGEAARIAAENLEVNADHNRRMRDRLINSILSTVPGSALNGGRENRLPNNCSFRFEGIDGEALLLRLDLAGVEASAGSACTAGSPESSHVLKAIGLTEEQAKSSLRLTTGRYTREKEIDETARLIREITADLRTMG